MLGRELSEDIEDWHDDTRYKLEAAEQLRLSAVKREASSEDMSISPSVSVPCDVTSPIFSSTSGGGRLLFEEWKPKSGECACWCSALTFEQQSDEPYQPEDTCVIDETDCYCGSEVDFLWDHREKHRDNH